MLLSVGHQGHLSPPNPFAPFIYSTNPVRGVFLAIITENGWRSSLRSISAAEGKIFTYGKHDENSSVIIAKNMRGRAPRQEARTNYLAVTVRHVQMHPNTHRGAPKSIRALGSARAQAIAPRSAWRAAATGLSCGIRSNQPKDAPRSRVSPGETASLPSAAIPPAAAAMPLAR